MEQTPFEDQQFDAVFCYGVIFLTDWKKSLREFYRILKPGGILYVNANSAGWYMFLWNEEHNKANDFNPRKIVAKTFTDTINFQMSGKFEKEMSLIIESEELIDELISLGFVNTKTGSEGTLKLSPYDLEVEPFFIGDYKGQKAVYEVYAEKKKSLMCSASLKTTQTLRVAFVGNIANNFFREAMAIRSTRLEIDLFLNFKLADNTMLPESDQPELKNLYPNWIKDFEGFKTSKLAMLAFFIGLPGGLRRLNIKMINVLNKYDLCVFSSKESWFIPFLNNKRIFRCTGSDLTVAPLFKFSEYKKLQGQKTGHLIQDFRPALEWRIKRKLSSKAIQSADFVDVSCGVVFSNAS